MDGWMDTLKQQANTLIVKLVNHAKSDVSIDAITGAFREVGGKERHLANVGRLLVALSPLELKSEVFSMTDHNCKVLARHPQRPQCPGRRALQVLERAQTSRPRLHGLR